MKHIHDIIIVEGKSDVAFLSHFISATFLMTGGTSLSPNFYKQLNQLSKNRGIIVLTDPDGPGERIRKAIQEKYPNAKHVFLHRSQSIKHGKVGVAESSVQHVLEQLEQATTLNPSNPPIYSAHDLFEWGLMGQANSYKRREQFCEQLNLGLCNGKLLLQRLNHANVSRETIQKVLEGLV